MSHKKHFRIGFIIVLFCVILGCGIYAVYFLYEVRIRSAPRENSLPNKDREWMMFEKELVLSGAGSFEEAVKNVPTVVEQLTGYLGFLKICYLLVKDQICIQGDELSKYLSSLLNDSIIRPCMNGRSSYEVCANTFIRSLGETNNPPSSKESEALAQFNSEIALAGGNGVETAVMTSVAFAETGIETMFLRSFISYIRSVLSHIGLRVGKTTASGISCAIADGPFPIGDAVGIALIAAGGIWTGYDLYQARIVMPAQLKEELRNAIERFRKHSYSVSLKRARTAYLKVKGY